MLKGKKMSDTHVTMSIKADLVNAPASIYVAFDGVFDENVDMMIPYRAKDESWDVVVTANYGGVIVDERGRDSKYTACVTLNAIDTSTDEGASIWCDTRDVISFIHDFLDLMCAGAWNEDDVIHELGTISYTNVVVEFSQEPVE